MICRLSIDSSTLVVEPVLSLGLPDSSKRLPLTRLSVGASRSTVGFSAVAASCFSDRVFTWEGPDVSRPVTGPLTVQSTRFGSPVAAVSDNTYAYAHNRRVQVVSKGRATKHVSLDVDMEEGDWIVELFAFSVGDKGGVAVVVGCSDGTVHVAFARGAFCKWEWNRTDNGGNALQKRQRHEVREMTYHFGATSSADGACISVIRLEATSGVKLGFTVYTWAIDLTRNHLPDQ
jgi:hypothetical protein